MALHSFHLPDETSEELHEAAVEAGRSVNEFLAELVAAEVESLRHARVMALAGRIAAGDAAIVHRLGTV